MSKPKRRLLGTSENLLKGIISLSNFSHSSGMKGVLTQRRLDDGITALGVVTKGTAEGADMFALATGVLIASGWAIPRETVTFPGLADPVTGWFLSSEMAWGTVGEAGRCAEF
jgi:hypothetical protein